MLYRRHQLINPMVRTCNYISIGRIHRLCSSKYLKLNNNSSSLQYYSTDAIHTIVATPSTNFINTESIIDGDNSVDDTTSTDSNNSITKIQSTNQWINDIVIGEKLCPFAIPLWNKNKDKDSSTNSSNSNSPIRIVSSNATTVQDAITDVQKEIIALVGNKHIDSNNNCNSDINIDNCNKHETTLIVFDYDNDTILQSQQQSHTEHQHQQQFVHQQNNNFRQNYMDFVRLSWLLQEKAVGEQYQDLIHIVLFHPVATHQTYGYDSNNDNTNTNPGDYTIRSPYPTIHLLRQQDLFNVVQSNTNYSDYEYIPSRNKAKFIQQGLQICQERLQRCTRTK